MMTIEPKDVPTSKFHGYLLGAVSPRPICFASTVDARGNVNLSPYSFFNVFSAKPPIMVFSPARRVRDNTTKHTLENILETKEVTINIVNYAMVHQMSLSSTEYAKGINEFVKAGFTELPSEVVKPPRVKEAPVQFECRVNEVIPLGDHGGAGNLVICEVLKMHLDEAILDENGVIAPEKIDTVARMGGNWYSRAKTGMFEVEKPLATLGIGVDSLPEHIRLSRILTGNDLGKLANVEELPRGIHPEITPSDEVQEKAHQLLENGQVEAAWKVLAQK